MEIGLEKLAPPAGLKPVGARTFRPRTFRPRTFRPRSVGPWTFRPQKLSREDVSAFTKNILLLLDRVVT